jgi:bifunctional non-homologous end joining protein LigD
VGDWTKDNKGRGLGALLVGVRRDGKLLCLGRVGTGFSARLGEDLSRRLGPLKSVTCRSSASSPPGRRMSCGPHLTSSSGSAYGGWTEADGLPRHASFQGVREDNPSGEVTPPERPARRSKVTSNPASLGITHPDRVLWPATNETPDVTKADLAACYALHVDRTLARIGGRPLSIIRAPDRITGPLFFQRHAMRGQSRLIGTVNVSGQARPYLRVNDASGLAALAQIGVVELRPWGALADHPDIPRSPGVRSGSRRGPEL